VVDFFQKEMVGASRFGRQVPSQRAHIKARFISCKSPPLAENFNGRSGRLTFSAACQESLLIRRDGTLLLSRRSSAVKF